MGAPITTTPVVIYVGKWYCFVTNSYLSDPPVGCAGTLDAVSKCCWKGQIYKNWFEGGFECVDVSGFCGDLEEYAEETIEIHGPFATFAICNAYRVNL